MSKYGQTQELAWCIPKAYFKEKAEGATKIGL